MKKFYLLLLSLLLAAAADDGDMAEKIKLQNQNVVKAAASELSKELPKRVDRFTQLVDIAADGEMLIYTFEIDAAPKSDEEIIEEGAGRMKRNVTAGVCATSKRFLQSGISISYRYKSAATGRELFRFDIKKSDCALLR
ncbi:hypothetical protein NNO_0953 [Hydrogenimonas sp.]|nr:hypothetical protein NNO_0953 [Hydrogenimonas sp.]